MLLPWYWFRSRSKRVHAGRWDISGARGYSEISFLCHGGFAPGSSAFGNLKFVVGEVYMLEVDITHGRQEEHWSQGGVVVRSTQKWQAPFQKLGRRDMTEHNRRAEHAASIY